MNIMSRGFPRKSFIVVLQNSFEINCDKDLGFEIKQFQH